MASIFMSDFGVKADTKFDADDFALIELLSI
jgi:hypothetical protein